VVVSRRRGERKSTPHWRSSSRSATSRGQTVVHGSQRRRVEPGATRLRGPAGPAYATRRRGTAPGVGRVLEGQGRETPEDRHVGLRILADHEQSGAGAGLVGGSVRSSGVGVDGAERGCAEGDPEVLGGPAGFHDSDRKPARLCHALLNRRLETLRYYDLPRRLNPKIATSRGY
jgi:hypothetical protein